MDCSLPGSSVYGILQAGILEWVAISFSRGSSRPRDRIQVSLAAGRLFTDGATRVQNKTINHALKYLYSCVLWTFPRWLSAGDAYSIPGSGRSPGGGHGNPLLCSCLENPMERRVRKATVHSVTKSQTWLKQLRMYRHYHTGKKIESLGVRLRLWNIYLWVWLWVFIKQW